MAGTTYDYEAENEIYTNMTSGKTGLAITDKIHASKLQEKAAKKSGNYAEYLMGFYGIEDPMSVAGDEITELRRVASEGLDPQQFRRKASGLAGMSARGITTQGAERLSGLGVQYGDELSAGLIGRYQAGIAAEKVRSFGEIMTQLVSSDMQTREEAKQLLLQYMLQSAELKQNIVISEEMRRAHAKGA